VGPSAYIRSKRWARLRLAMTLLDMIDLLSRRCSASSRLVWIQAYRIDSQCCVTVAHNMCVLSQKRTGIGCRLNIEPPKDIGIVTVGFFLLIRGLAGDLLSLRRCAFPWSPREEIPPITAHPHPNGQSSTQERGVSARLRRSPLHKSTGMRGSPPAPPGNQLTSDTIRSGG
jgi:hypothetical protein